jgi:hypothetical protein
MDELKDAFGTSQILEMVLAEVAQGGPLRQLVYDQRCRRRRQQHLAAVAGRHDPRGPVQGRAVVVPVALGSLACMQPHPDTKRSGLTPLRRREAVLSFQAGAGAVGSGGEDRHQSVARTLHHLPVRGLDGFSQDGVVAFESVLHPPVMLLPKPRAALDVREQEGERLRCQLSIH